MKVTAQKGAEAFERYYSETYGPRWSSLKKELTEKARKIPLENPFLKEGRLDQSPTEYKPYELDKASVIAALALKPEPGLSYLDMCAAPGGKSLTLIFDLKGEGEWTLNDASSLRLTRLKRVLREQLPKDLSGRIKVTHYDGSRIGQYQPESFDRILVDAPCSGERHLLANSQELAKWTPARSRKHQTRQYALLCSALQAIKPGGLIVYSTCSLSPIENDQVIERLKKKKGDQFKIVTADHYELGEPTTYGWTVLPDRAEGFGPIYFSVLQKVPMEK